jgi:hypothetical protein
MTTFRFRFLSAIIRDNELLRQYLCNNWVERPTENRVISEKCMERQPVQQNGFTDLTQQRIGNTDGSKGESQQIIRRTIADQID